MNDQQITDEVPGQLGETRSRLIRAAAELFAAKGFTSTSVKDVLLAADAGSGSLYHFFPGKQDLLLAVLDAYREGIRPMLFEPAWRGVDDPIERIFALLGCYRHLLESSDCSYGCPIGNLALEIHEPDPPVREGLKANFAAWTREVEECFREAADQLPQDTDWRRLATFVLVTMEGGVMLSRTYRSLGPFDDAVSELRCHIDRLLAAGRPAERATAADPLEEP